MIFLDTCVWFELLGVRTPVEQHEIQQASLATTVLSDALATQEVIVTCQEQIVELISATEKAKMKAINKQRKINNLAGVGSIKEFRKLQEFTNVKLLCETIVEDLMKFAVVKDIGIYDIEFVVNKLDVADINDLLYHDYCTKNGVDVYTFDSDWKDISSSDKIHILR